MLRYQGTLCVHDVDRLRDNILEETHVSRYSINPGSKKIYHDLREICWCEGLKRDIEEFVAKYPNFQKEEVKNLKSGSLLKEIQISTWKWEYIK